MVSLVYKFFHKKSASLAGKSTCVSGLKSEIILNQQLAEELRKPIIRKFEKGKVYSYFKDNIWEADSTNMQLKSKFNKVLHLQLCAFDIYSNYAWIVPLKDEKGIKITNAFQNNLDESNYKPHKVWVDNGSNF